MSEDPVVKGDRDGRAGRPATPGDYAGDAREKYRIAWCRGREAFNAEILSR